MTEYALRPKYRRASDVDAITGISQAAQRDLKRRKYAFGEQTGGWLRTSPFDLAKLLFVKTLRDSGIEWAEAWRRAQPETVGNIVLHALLLKGAADWTAGNGELRKNVSLRKKWAFEFVSEYSGGAVGGGDYYVFGPVIPANQYRTIQEAIETGIEEGKRLGDDRPLVMHIVLMRDLSRVLVDRAQRSGGELALLERID